MCIRVKTYEIYQLSNIGILLLKYMFDEISICVHTDIIIVYIYAKYLMGLYGRCIHIYGPHMKSLQSTM